MSVEQPAYATGVSLQDARELIVAVAAEHRLTTETVALETALHRVLAADIHAPFDVPGFANSAMDGFALRGADLPQSGERALQLIGQIFAGGDNVLSVGEGECVRITTGAPIPYGADTVVIKENVRVDGDRVWINAGEKPGGNTRPAGEDYRAGDLAFRTGTLLTAAQLGTLASFGCDRITVTRRIRAVLLTTGDELAAAGMPLGFGQIHNSNRFSLGGLLQTFGVDLLRHQHLRDDPTLLRAALQQAASDADIVLSSGGVSAGEADYLPGLLAEIGRIHLWKVRIKPGMPFLFGSIGQALIFSLPGNPVSGIATFLSLVRPALDTLLGINKSARKTWRARLQSAIQKRHSRTEFLRATLICDENGTLWAAPLAKQGSGMLRGVTEADVLLIVPEDMHDLAQGSVVEFLPLPGLI
ncbi:molybdopterin molybdenumtransferase MoeA [Pseudolysobacter antarcticus]|uniref:Molybdopterin molybdenumtransferase n=1 Tax=Pseudolysobacter antarcticus TaxID=2511995 RepID=A0A411HJS5_9GAMM|nr:gephyrin-like molybdotransferase Glp [Pseudolysobacter antarcticus]QBB70654.1 molybdopterin molybdenumtransferase MoeA [Pseudolysobacter antarcticus]